MKAEDLKAKLKSIQNDIEEVIGASLGHAPHDFYSEDEDGNTVISKSRLAPFASKADGAYDRLTDLINSL